MILSVSQVAARPRIIRGPYDCGMRPGWVSPGCPDKYGMPYLTLAGSEALTSGFCSMADTIGEFGWVVWDSEFAFPGNSIPPKLWPIGRRRNSPTVSDPYRVG